MTSALLCKKDVVDFVNSRLNEIGVTVDSIRRELEECLPFDNRLFYVAKGPGKSEEDITFIQIFIKSNQGNVYIDIELPLNKLKDI